MSRKEDNSQKHSNLPTFEAQVADRIEQIQNDYVYRGKHTLAEVDALLMGAREAVRKEMGL